MAPSSGASRCRQGRLNVGAPELIQGCLIFRLSKMGEGHS